MSDVKRTRDRYDACCIAAWPPQADQDDILTTYVSPCLKPRDAAQASVERWIPGVLGLGSRPAVFPADSILSITSMRSGARERNRAFAMAMRFSGTPCIP